MVFEDLDEGKDTRHSEFVVCNESVAVWRKLLDGITVKRAASICSAGEIAFFAILPIVDEELLAIDYSYGSL
jgi:hypothetical protein